MKYVMMGCILLAVLMGCRADHTEKEGTRLTVPVTNVIDGDTFKVEINGKEETIRVLLIDTPETHHPKLGVQPYGQAAAAFTKKSLNGKKVTLELAVNGERDAYGRRLAYVFVDGKSLEEQLLRRGLARLAYVYEPNTNHLQAYKKAEDYARKRKLNIWSTKGYAESDGFHPEVIQGYNSSPGKENRGFDPDDKGNCQGKIKGNITHSGDKIYHLSSDPYYFDTVAERCFNSKKEARIAGFRAVK
ncbi:micrococcal nuclease [Pullulanibacillus pueri]|uniref:TNase-like domain-containing protein n=1 Tax=Pullulanibacillus pueri TaxID=1437324 RepID=A0A8J3EMU8_9BACL|nr:thermonuclease family protein [Pullulanibacillus pueri]MBM7683587.1 micrococcal nuclease [Pullulanibacillus pueri]GGH84518.1 hypothetical protein GCM10007096_27780 [Pullulanibacillus pueri]